MSNNNQNKILAVQGSEVDTDITNTRDICSITTCYNEITNSQKKYSKPLCLNHSTILFNFLNYIKKHHIYVKDYRNIFINYFDNMVFKNNKHIINYEFYLKIIKKDNDFIKSFLNKDHSLIPDEQDNKEDNNDNNEDRKTFRNLIKDHDNNKKICKYCENIVIDYSDTDFYIFGKYEIVDHDIFRHFVFSCELEKLWKNKLKINIQNDDELKDKMLKFDIPKNIKGSKYDISSGIFILEFDLYSFIGSFTLNKLSKRYFQHLTDIFIYCINNNINNFKYTKFFKDVKYINNKINYTFEIVKNSNNNN